MSRAWAPDVWLLTGDRAGEVAQQRALGGALGLSVRELQVARMAAVGKQVTFDLAGLQPPWPRVAISFGKTLFAALHLRALAGLGLRLVHLGLPRRVPSHALDLIVPMPTDRYIDAPNVLRIRMPFNSAPLVRSPAASRLQASGLPRPWTALIIGGHTTRARLEPRDADRIMNAVQSRVMAHGGSLLISTSPRTPANVVSVVEARRKVPGETHVFDASRAVDNPYGMYLSLSDELIVTGDSASMIAECWRTGHPVWVAPLRRSAPQGLMRALRAAVPQSLIASGRVAADVDIDWWIRSLVRAGDIGLLGSCDPRRTYRYEVDDDLSRVAARVRALLDDGSL